MSLPVHNKVFQIYGDIQIIAISVVAFFFFSVVFFFLPALGGHSIRGHLFQLSLILDPWTEILCNESVLIGHLP